MEYYSLKEGEIIQENDEINTAKDYLNRQRWEKVSPELVGTKTIGSDLVCYHKYRRAHKMVKIDNLDITVKYSVGLTTFEMPEIVRNQLLGIAKEIDGIDALSYHKYPEADQWLKDNITESDCHRLSYEVEDIYLDN